MKILPAVWFLVHPSSSLKRRENHLLERDTETMRYGTEDIPINLSFEIPD